MDTSPQANPPVSINEQSAKRGQYSGSHAGSDMAGAVVLVKKGKRSEDDGQSPYTYYSQDAENADLDSA